MPEFNPTLSAPWRIQYVRALSGNPEDEGCFLCRYWAEPGRDAENHVLWRGPGCFAAMNRFPYNNGHVLIAPGSHKANLGDLAETELDELIRRIRDVQVLLRETLHPHGFNVGMNFGRCAGAGLPDHLHAHIVPRWDGDTNFMFVTGNARVIPQDMTELYGDLADAAIRLGLPPLVASA